MSLTAKQFRVPCAESVACNGELFVPSKQLQLLTADKAINKVKISHKENEIFEMKVTDTALDLKKGVTYKFDMNQCLFDETIDIADFNKNPQKYMQKLKKGDLFSKEYDLQSIPDDPFTFQFRVEGSHNIDSFPFNEIFLYGEKTASIQ